MMPWWILAVAVFGVNLTLWGSVGLLRLVDAASLHYRRHSPAVRMKSIVSRHARGARRRPTVRDVAVLIAAHNEEPVIVDSLRAIMPLVPAGNVHVVSDGSTDRTVQLARAAGAHVMSTTSNVGKAGALQAGIRRFRLVDRFQVVMLLDADTRVEPGYFDAALPLFDDPEVVAVAGCVRAAWRGRRVSRFGSLVSFHRQRIYWMTQHLLKFGQTWKRVNATHIVPGFASLYRTTVLPLIEVNPPGLVIEDFNMTFEVYQKRLGKVGFTPSAVASTQDPGTLCDYMRQCRRWSLGLWQTVRRHPPRANLFTAMLALLLLELLTSSFMLLLLPCLALFLVLPDLIPPLAAVPMVSTLHGGVASVLGVQVLLFGVVVPDFVVTCLVALVHRQPRFLLFSGFFLPLRVLDSAITLYALGLVWRSGSTGRWRSPRRYRVEQRSIESLPDERAAS